MFVYNPKTLYDAWPAFYAFVDFLIRMVREDKIKVTKARLASSSNCFNIWLSESQDVREESKINFGYEPYRGLFVGTVTPIRRFRFELIGQGIVLADLESKDAQSYDKMLELFKAIVDYVKRHDQKWYERILDTVVFASLERANWKKSKDEIKRELNETWEVRKAREDFEREERRIVSNLTEDYRRQGYKIID